MGKRRGDTRKKLRNNLTPVNQTNQRKKPKMNINPDLEIQELRLELGQTRQKLFHASRALESAQIVLAQVKLEIDQLDLLRTINLIDKPI